jgi:hypothetical protein
MEQSDPLEPLYLSYGRALANWAQVERWLGIWFSSVTGMPRDLSDRIFFSVNNFQSRSRMLQSAIAKSELNTDALEFIKAAVTRRLASTHSATRLLTASPLCFTIKTACDQTLAKAET